jgi:SAM-dependent methyltransferase
VQNITEVYHRRYQEDSVSDQALQAYSEIADVLNRMFRPRRVIDIGSGGGALIRAFHRLGVHAVGVEGSAHAVALMPESIDLVDLREVWTPKGTYDLVTCFDVAEHIEPEFADVLADNIRKCMHPGSILVFGAAPEGQDGLGHVNCQHPVYWMGKLGAASMLQPHTSEILRYQIRSKPSTSFLWWVAKNLFVMEAPRSEFL